MLSNRCRQRHSGIPAGAPAVSCGREIPAGVRSATNTNAQEKERPGILVAKGLARRGRLEGRIADADRRSDTLPHPTLCAIAGSWKTVLPGVCSTRHPQKDQIFLIPEHPIGACSSAGRAPHLQCGGQQFDPAQVHARQRTIAILFLLALPRLAPVSLHAALASLPSGVTGNALDSGSRDSWFNPREGNFTTHAP